MSVAWSARYEDEDSLIR